MTRLLDREPVRWLVPAIVALLAFGGYTAVTAFGLLSSGAPDAMIAARDESRDDDREEEDDEQPADEEGDGEDTDEPAAEPEDPEGPAATCEELFSPAVVQGANGAGLVLNPEWAEDADPGVLALDDGELSSALDNLPILDCRWVGPDGDSGVGIRSVLAVVNETQAARIGSRLVALGYRPQAELGGTRYFFESNSGGVPYGESHIVLNGVWFATHWRGYGPRGYTADMVTNYFN